MTTICRRLFWPVILQVAIVIFVEAFNFDVKYPVIATGKSDSYFGYSLAVHQTYTSQLIPLTLLVGAPKELRGALYQCRRSESTFKCNSINGDKFDSGKNKFLRSQY